MQIKYLNRALQRFNSTQVIPTQFVLFTISVILGSAILYRDFERRTLEDAIKFFAGCALTFLGVWFITSGRSNDDDSDEEDEDDEEEDEIDVRNEERQLPEIREQDEDQSHPASEPMTPTMKTTDASQPETPIFKFTRFDDLDEQSPLAGNPWARPNPASASAVHTDVSELPSRRGQPPPIHATTSTPVLPTMSTRPSRPELRR